MSTYKTIIDRGPLLISVNLIDDGRPLRIDMLARTVYLNDEEMQAIVSMFADTGPIVIDVADEDREFVVRLISAMLALNGVTATIAP